MGLLTQTGLALAELTAKCTVSLIGNRYWVILLLACCIMEEADVIIHPVICATHWLLLLRAFIDTATSSFIKFILITHLISRADFPRAGIYKQRHRILPDLWARTRWSYAISEITDGLGGSDKAMSVQIPDAIQNFCPWHCVVKIWLVKIWQKWKKMEI